MNCIGKTRGRMGLRRAADILLGLLLALSCFPAPVHAAGQTDPLSGVKDGDLVYFGMPDDATHFDGAWRVLDSEKTNTGEPGMFLLSENLIGSDTGGGVFFRNESDPKNNDYQGSDAQKWCSRFLETAFSEAEQAAILPTCKSDGAFAKEHIFETPFSAADGGGGTRAVVNFDAAEHILDGDKIFPLSAEEADSIRYGFDGNGARIAGFDGAAASWWLRSPHDPSFPIDVGIVFFNGWLLDFFENQDNVFGTGPVYMRPALNLDRGKVVSAEEVAEGEWTLVLEGESPGGAAVEQYRFGARGEIQENRAALRPLWIIGGIAVLFIIVVIIVIVLMVRKIRAGRIRRRKENP